MYFMIYLAFAIQEVLGMGRLIICALCLMILCLCPLIVFH